MLVTGSHLFVHRHLQDCQQPLSIGPSKSPDNEKNHRTGNDSCKNPTIGHGAQEPRSGQGGRSERTLCYAPETPTKPRLGKDMVNTAQDSCIPSPESDVASVPGAEQQLRLTVRSTSLLRRERALMIL